MAAAAAAAIRLLLFILPSLLAAVLLAPFPSPFPGLRGDSAFFVSVHGLPTSLDPDRFLPLQYFPEDTFINRSVFPPDFIFGALTVAVKHEGAGSTGGKSDSIWDSYARVDGVVIDGTVPGNLGEEYNRYPEDIKEVVDMGMDAFRFSIAWTRIFPNGTGSPNAEAIAHYNKVIDLLLENDIEPHVTLWVEDHPQALEERYGGPLSPLFIDDFVVYANVCFAEFGDRVKYWITFDEPNDWVSLAYASSQSPPGRCTPGVTLHGTCTQGNASTEPYLVAHHVLLAHAAAAQLYKSQYQANQGGFIGIALWFKWYEPLNVSNPDDIFASNRAQDFFFGWFMDPLFFGKYPETMRLMVGPRLPEFTDEQAENLRQSLDFVGLNVVTASYVTNDTQLQDTYDGYFEDMRIKITAYRDDEAIGEGESEYSVPWCIEKIVDYMKTKYENPPIYITETGWGIETTSSFEEAVNDTERIQYFHSYYKTISESISSGGDVRGVFAWSLIDGFEFFLGLQLRFGLFYVDDNMDRYPRLSAFWHQVILSKNGTSLGLSKEEPSLYATV